MTPSPGEADPPPVQVVARPHSETRLAREHPVVDGSRTRNRSANAREADEAAKPQVDSGRGYLLLTISLFQNAPPAPKSDAAAARRAKKQAKKQEKQRADAKKAKKEDEDVEKFGAEIVEALLLACGDNVDKINGILSVASGGIDRDTPAPQVVPNGNGGVDFSFQGEFVKSRMLKKLLTAVNKDKVVKAAATDSKKTEAAAKKAREGRIKAEETEQELQRLQAAADANNAQNAATVQAHRAPGTSQFMHVLSHSFRSPVPSSSEATMEMITDPTVVRIHRIVEKEHVHVLAPATAAGAATTTETKPMAAPHPPTASVTAAATTGSDATVAAVLSSPQDALRAKEKLRAERKSQQRNLFVQMLPPSLAGRASEVCMSSSGAAAWIPGDAKAFTATNGDRITQCIAFARKNGGWIVLEDTVIVAGVEKVVSLIYYDNSTGYFVVHDEEGSMTTPGHTKVTLGQSGVPTWAIGTEETRKEEADDEVLSPLKPPDLPAVRARVETKKEEKKRTTVTKRSRKKKQVTNRKAMVKEEPSQGEEEEDDCESTPLAKAPRMDTTPPNTVTPLPPPMPVVPDMAPEPPLPPTLPPAQGVKRERDPSM